MHQTILYDEAYEYNLQSDRSGLDFHFDYGMRYNEINMLFQHFHPVFEVYYMLNGSAEHIIEGKNYIINENDFVILKPYQLHKTNYYENNQCKRLILTFSLEFFFTHFPEASRQFVSLIDIDKPLFRFSDSINSEFIDLFNRMYKVSKKQCAIKELEIVGLFIEFISRFNTYAHFNTYTSSIKNTTLDDKIYEIAAYIHNHYDKDLSLDTLSDMHFISPHYLSRKFKTITGFTLIQYIQETRIKRAQQFLLDTDMKIITIVERCGFGSLSQFNRVFNSIVHTSPSCYRKKNRLAKN